MNKIAFLKNLTTLDIDLHFNNAHPFILKLVEKNVQLKSLKLHNIIISDIISKEITGISSLEELYFFNSFAADDIDISRVTTQLKHLKIISALGKESSIQDLTKIIANAPNITHIEIELRDEEEWNSVNYTNLLQIIAIKTFDAYVCNFTIRKISIITHFNQHMKKRYLRKLN